MKRKSAHDIVQEAYQELVKLEPTCKEIEEYARLMEETYGVVSYSESRQGRDNYLRFHATWGKSLVEEFT